MFSYFSPMNHGRFLFVGLAFFSLLSASGCGGKGTVHGKVTDQEGKPVVNGLITFIVNEDAQTGTIGPDGSFSVPQIAPGKAKVIVSSPEPGDMNAKMGGGSSTPLEKGPPEQIERMKEERKRQEDAKKNWFPVDKKYSSAKDTPLTCEVEKGAKEVNFKVDRAEKATRAE